jgi:antitoxin component of RelBE/YafQ-DinJ toxin-antitoxin module
MELWQRLTFAATVVLCACAARAGELKTNPTSTGNEVGLLAIQLNGSEQAKSSSARNRLVILHPSELLPALPEILKLVKDGSWQHDDAAAVMRVLGPDCSDAVPIFFKAIREEKDAVRRRTLVRLVSLLGTSAAKELPVLRTIATRDLDAEVRKEAERTIERIGITDVKLDESLRLLKLRSYRDLDEAKAARVALDLVQDNWGVRCDLIQEMVRLGIDNGARHDPPSDGHTGEFLSYGFSLLRIGTPVIMEAIEGEDGKRRKAGLAILVWSASSQNPSSWYATKLMGDLLAFMPGT